MQDALSHFPDLGFGLGLRITHYAHIFEHWPRVDWFEIISENFMDTDGRPKRNIARIRERYPVVMHGVSLSIGSTDPLNLEYLKKLKKLVDFIQPAWISDHLCWTGTARNNVFDLLPLPYTEESLKHVITRVKMVQDYLGRPIALENPSSYLEFKSSCISEAEFMAELAQESGCHLLLDVNNVYVSCFNHRLEPKAYIDALPLGRIAQIHLSGHMNLGTHIIDTHDDHVTDEVWALYRYAIHKSGRVINTMIEWDDKIPEFNVLYTELEIAKQAAHTAKAYAPLPVFTRDALHQIANILTPLQETQSLMQEAILGNGGAHIEPGEWIRPKAGYAPADQLGVYINAYRFRLYEVTEEDYPVLRYYLGAERFNTLLHDFINGTRCGHFNIGKYPALLPEFLGRHPLGDCFARELAALENAVTQIASWEETAALTPAHLQEMTAETLMETIMRPRKALRLFAFNYPVNRYYNVVQAEAAPATPPPEKTFLAVFRHEDVVWRMDLEEDEHHLLKRLFAGKPAGKALEALHAQASEVDEAQIARWFSRWISNGLLAHYEHINA